MTTPHVWRSNHAQEVIDAAAARTAQKAHEEAQRFAEWRRPSGDTQSLVRVGHGELTCVRCGETYGVSTPVTGGITYCWRCGGRNGVPTTSYLREGEYVEVH